MNLPATSCGVSCRNFPLFAASSGELNQKAIKGKLLKIIEYRTDLIISPIILMIINFDYWIVLGVSGLLLVFYELTRYYSMQIVEKQKKIAMAKIEN